MGYVIEGTVKNLQGIRLEGVQVAVHNTTRSNYLKYSDVGQVDLTTNTNGVYTCNLDDLTGGWAVGDVLNVVFGYNQELNYVIRRVSHVVTSGGGAQVNCNYLFHKVMANHQNSNHDFLAQDFNHAQALIGTAFIRKVDAADAISLATSFANATGSGAYLEIPSGYVAYVTEVGFSATGTTDIVTLAIASNSESDATGNSYAISGELCGKSPGFYHSFKVPLRIVYNSGRAKSVVMRFKGSGTTDDLVAWFAGYLIREEY